MTVKTPQDVRDFWFSDAMKPWWFAKSDEIDRQIIQLFGETYEAAHGGHLDHWMGDPQDALALVIALDQFPRNMFRGSARSFESNDLALRHARAALDRGHDRQVDPEARQFFYLPFMHSEDLDDQDRSVRLYEELGNENSLKFAREHRDIIARFDRFPHRNAVLGRETRPEEAEFLKTHQGF
ncbi:DUF924 family protein [Paracoccus spongiarum]|uniref:DUF924 family protein n=1 Tax=Paracoccus spongiarum TaxID=3064387 RepID=A0ABT9J7Z2_9RHOB|nr:DUF924 family protein [Paracoccus sp. 2205BS29-5]MDP5305855.1 DUF924 family protein [Paracoccus sp. 2205BS29-5]